jgi:hypothetical protein
MQEFYFRLAPDKSLFSGTKQDLGSSSRKGVGVQVPSSAPQFGRFPGRILGFVCPAIAIGPVNSPQNVNRAAN